MHDRLRDIVLGAIVAMLTISIVGTIAGLVCWPLVTTVFSHANRALLFVGFAINFTTALVAIAALTLAAHRMPSHQRLLDIARFAAIVLAVELVFSYVAGEARTLLIVQGGNWTQIDFTTVPWAVVLRAVVPAVLLFAVLRPSVLRRT